MNNHITTGAQPSQKCLTVHFNMQNEDTLDPQEEIKEEETAEEAVEESENPEGESDSTDVEAELARAKAEAAKWRRLAQKAKPEPKPHLPTVERKIDDEAIDLRLDGYSKAEVAFILKNGGRQALEDPFVKGAIAQIREQSKAEEEVSKAKDTSGATSFEKKFPKDKLEKMSAEELAKILPHSEE